MTDAAALNAQDFAMENPSFAAFFLICTVILFVDLHGWKGLSGALDLAPSSQNFTLCDDAALMSDDTATRKTTLGKSISDLS